MLIKAFYKKRKEVLAMDRVISKISRNNLILILMAGIYILINFYSPVFAVLLLVSILGFILIQKNPILGLGLFIIMIPFSSVSLIMRTIGEIQGLKIFNLVSICMIVGYILSQNNRRFENADKLFFFGVLSFYTIAAVRSFSYIENFSDHFWEGQFSMVSYLQNNIFKSFMFFVPFILISVFIKKRKEIVSVSYWIIGSVFFLSLFLLVFYIFFTPLKIDFQSVRDGFANFFTLHGNELVNFYIATFPILLAVAVSTRKKGLLVINVLVLFIVAILYSRAAYIIILISAFMYFLISRRKRYVPIFIAVLLVLALIIPNNVLDRAVTGIDGVDLNYFSAGRTDEIWKPLLEEISKDPKLLLLGIGLHPMAQTNTFKNHLMLNVGHAHNMYVTTILEVGLIGLIFYLIFLVYFLVVFIRVSFKIEDDLLKNIMFGVVIAIIGFLIRGMTDGFFLPLNNNAFLWVALGLGCAIKNHFKTSIEQEGKDVCQKV